MTGLTEDDLSRLTAGLMLTQNMVSSEATPTAPTEQMLRIIAALRDETNTRMLLDVAKQDGESDRAALEWIENRSCLPNGVTIETTACDEKYTERRSVFYGGQRDRHIMVSWGPKMGHFRHAATLRDALASAMRLSPISPE